MSEQSSRFLRCASVLPVDNLVETIQFYREKLGFETSLTYGNPPHYAIVRRGEGASVHLSEREDSTESIHPCSLYIFVTHVDAVYAEYNAKGLRIFAPPEDTQYGMREFELSDLNGHFLTFGQSSATEPESK